jgi:hypothetical protein
MPLDFSRYDPKKADAIRALYTEGQKQRQEVDAEAIIQAELEGQE